MTRRRTILGMIGGAAFAAGAKVAVIAHRGEHLAHAENTVAAIDAAIRLGSDFVEIDVRTTRDGAFVLMHDAGVERMTGGKGMVAELSLAQIRELRMNGERVPTLDEALDTMRGRCGVYLDAKAIGAEAIVAALTRHRMMDRAVVYGGFALLAELAQRGHGGVVMPEAVSVERLRKSLDELKPRVVAFDRRDFRDEVIAVAREAGVGIFVDRLGADDNSSAWNDAVRRGATGIQTDHPAELAAMLR
ncbi:MAG: glycerophosphodiester phosphodiesterase family protein [Bryobacteraceae bacterium]